MTDAPRHTPYDGSSKLFEIGLKPLEPEAWIDTDARLSEYLAEKERLIATARDEVFAAEGGTEAAQEEVLGLLVEHLPQRFPDVYRREGDAMLVAPGDRRVALNETPALLTAARLIQDDLVLMRRAQSGWRLAAGCVCFPSAWQVREKFGKPVDAIHAPVPGFGPGSRPAELIARMFDNLRPGRAVIRWNWSLYGDAALAHPHVPKHPRFGTGDIADPVFLRSERQTMRKLPASGDVLFTIKVSVDPLASLDHHPNGAEIAQTLIAQLEALSDEQLAYKGMTGERDRVVRRLRDLTTR